MSFIHRQIFGRSEPRGVIEAVDGEARSHDELFHSCGKCRSDHVVTDGQVVTEIFGVAEHVGNFPCARPGLEAVTRIGKSPSRQMNYGVGPLEETRELLRLKKIN